MNIDEILDGLQKAIEEMREERNKLIAMEENAANLITEAEMWFGEHEHELPEKGE